MSHRLGYTGHMRGWEHHARQVLAGAFVCSVAVAVPGGCSADDPLNPSFPLRFAEAKAILHDMRQEPKPLQRPVLVAGGIHDPGLVAQGTARKLRRVTTDSDQIISVSFFGFGADTFEECRVHLIDTVERDFPSDDPQETIEIDVVAFSMGGLVARDAAKRREDGGRRLKIRRLFTISTPHRGARLADLPAWDQRKIDMRAGSEFLAGLDEDLARADYELHAYVRLGDLIVGAANAAPPRRTPWWVANAPLSFAHIGAGHDPRILADIARHLRGEPPLTIAPAAPLPDEGPPPEGAP